MATANVKATVSDEDLDVTERVDSLAVHKARLQKSKTDKEKVKERQNMNVSDDEDAESLQVDGRVDSIALAKQRMGLPKGKHSGAASRFAKQQNDRRSSLSGSISTLGRKIARSLSLGSKGRDREEGQGN